MPELDFPDAENTPYNPDAEYIVELDGATLLVSFSGHTAYVKLPNGDHLDAKVYRERHIKPSLRNQFFREIRYLHKEFHVQS